MQVKTLTLFLVILIFNSLSAQSPSFDFSAKVLYAPIQEATINSNIDFSRISSINDTTAIQSFFTASLRTEKEYKPELGYEIMSNINFHINDKFRIRTGLGINLNRLSIGSNGSSFVEETLISSDTIGFISNPVPTSSPTSFCGVYLNTSSEFDVEDDVQYNIINLRIPLEASIDLIDSKLRLNLGVYMQTPIFSNRYREYLSLSRELIDNEYHCKYSLNQESNRSGGGLSNLIFGYSVGAEYFISNNIALEIGALRDVENTFYNAPGASGFSNNLEDLTSTRYSIGLRYSLSKKVIPE